MGLVRDMVARWTAAAIAAETVERNRPKIGRQG
jgi:hypothetical protein